MTLDLPPGMTQDLHCRNKPVASGKWLVASGRWLVVSGCWLMAPPPAPISHYL